MTESSSLEQLVVVFLFPNPSESKVQWFNLIAFCSDCTATQQFVQMFALRRRPLYHLSLLANWGHKVVSRPFGDKFEGGLPDMSTQVRVKELIGSLKGDERQLLYGKRAVATFHEIAILTCA